MEAFSREYRGIPEARSNILTTEYKLKLATSLVLSGQNDSILGSTWSRNSTRSSWLPIFQTFKVDSCPNGARPTFWLLNTSNPNEASDRLSGENCRMRVNALWPGKESYI